MISLVSVIRGYIESIAVSMVTLSRIPIAPGLSLVDLEDEEDVWSAVDSWSSGRTTASSSFGVSNATGNAYMASKRSSGADSAATGVSITTPGDVDGIGTTSFTRDFYRLVKFESNKSLASSSSKSQVSEPGAVRDGSAQK